MNKFMIFFLAISFSAISCRDGNDEMINSVNNSPRAEDFPQAIGSQFVYLYIDSLLMFSDTVVVTIAGTRTFGDEKEVMIWQYQYSARIDTLYVYSSGDTVKVYRNLEYLSGFRASTIYVFPLEIGKGWKGGFASDTNVVVARESVSLLSGSFNDAYIIEEQWGILNDYGQVFTWFVPQVGVVRKHHRGWSFGSANQTWELIDYTLTDM